MCISTLGMPAFSIAEKYSLAHTAWILSCQPAPAMKDGGASFGMGGVPFLLVQAGGKSEGPGSLAATKSGREVTPASGSLGALFLASNAGYWMAVAMVSSAPAEKPITPILCGSICHSAAWARTVRIACWMS